MADLSQFNWEQHDDDSGGVLLPPGSYICLVKQFKRVQRGRDTHLDCIVEIAVPVSARGLEPGSVVSGVAWETLPLTDKGLWKVAQYFKAVKAPTTINLNSDQEVARALKYKPFMATVIVDEWKGKSKNKIDTASQFTDEAEQYRSVVDSVVARLTDRTRSYDPGEPDAGDSALRSADGVPAGDFSDDDVPF